MLQNFSLHTHTVGFDGRNTVADMAQSAATRGMNAIGISNHFIVHPDIKNSRFYPRAATIGYANIYQTSFDDAIRQFCAHYDEIASVSKSQNIPILRGMEMDYFDTDDWHRGYARMLRELQPDYVIGTCHFIDYHGRLCNVHDIANADAAERDKMLAMYWSKIEQAARSGLFSFMAHLDLPKKVGVGREEKWHDTERRVIETLSKNNTPIEINTSGIPRNGTPYPGENILSHASRVNLPVVISDDAHSSDHIGRHFDTAEQLISQYNLSNRLNLQKILAFSNKTL